ncbi:malate synthase [Alteromonadaceae bacterium Bs31]|nr:malate synthase [Alteromonadaceae bacterium Bs31]
MPSYPRRANLLVARELCDFIELEALPGTGIDSDLFWLGFGRIVKQFSPRIDALLRTRDKLQLQLDKWHKQRPSFTSQPHDPDYSDYLSFLSEIGYLENPVDDFQITTTNVDPEFSLRAGPQQIVSAKNITQTIEATNGRWGSLYKALYESDIIGAYAGSEEKRGFNALRMEHVLRYTKDFLDETIPLSSGSHRHAHSYRIEEDELVVILPNGQATRLACQTAYLGYQGRPERPSAILLCNHGLHIELRFNPESKIGQFDKAGIEDVQLESTLSTIIDCEDSVASVDVEDKTQLYRNWLALMSNLLSLKSKRIYSGRNHEHMEIAGRSVLALRGVGYLMTHPALMDEHHNAIAETLLDLVVGTLIGIHDLTSPLEEKNSHRGSIYLVVPKLHGSDEVAMSNDLFDAIEDLFMLERHTLKLGLMDEERRTSVNLKNCIYAARKRLFMLNCDFKDRSADEIHTSMYAGPVVAISALKHERWYMAHENNNVCTALLCGLPGKAQIGKSMWEQPERMLEMMKYKIAQPQAGANAAWVPSPEAATLHAIHYHKVDVYQQQIARRHQAPPRLSERLRIPLLINRDTLTPSIVEAEVDKACQCILAYVARWIELGLGSSTVPDLHNVGHHESQATLRLACQQLANWLLHGICMPEQVEQSLCKMAKVVDEQHTGRTNYEPIALNREESGPYQAARTLIFDGHNLPNGYTEPLLHTYRLKYKAEHFMEALSA